MLPARSRFASSSSRPWAGERVAARWLRWLDRLRGKAEAVAPEPPLLFISPASLESTVVFLLQIVDRAGCVARLPGGTPLEVELVDYLTRSILAEFQRPAAGDSRLERWVLAKLPWRALDHALAAACRSGIRLALARLKSQTVRVAQSPYERAFLDASVRAAWDREDRERSRSKNQNQREQARPVGAGR